MPDRVILKGSEDAVAEFFVEGSCLKTEGVEERVRITYIDAYDRKAQRVAVFGPDILVGEVKSSLASWLSQSRRETAVAPKSIG